MAETIQHLAVFISRLWQIHIFGEGNTRTTAVFFIKYLRHLGFGADNDQFEEHSWYFRNALVRANYNNIKIVAKAFHKALDEYRDCFEVVEFAVYHTDYETENYKAFQAQFREVAAKDGSMSPVKLCTEIP